MALLCCSRATAQHTFGVLMGYGTSNGRFDPNQETKTVVGRYSGGVSWRYYSPQPGIGSFSIGSFGVDLEFLQQGYSFATNASFVEENEDYLYYTRRLNSIVMPIVWQPHVYMFKNRVRLYIEASATFSYNMGSTYDNVEAGEQGTYDFKLVRDNRFGYGIAGGGGLAFLFNQFELNFRARYYFGLADILKSRNKYSGNAIDNPAENPFAMSPLRSPLDNINISIGLSYRFDKDGFNFWKVKRQKHAKGSKDFNYSE